MKYTLICGYDTQEKKVYEFTANNRKEADNKASHIIFDIAYNNIKYVAFYEGNKLLYVLDYCELLWCLL